MSLLQRIYSSQQQSNNTNVLNFNYDVLSASTQNSIAQNSSRSTPILNSCWDHTTTAKSATNQLEEIALTSTNRVTEAESTAKLSTGSQAKVFTTALVIGALVAGIVLTVTIVLWKSSGSSSTTSSTSVVNTTTLIVTTATSTTTATTTTTSSSTSTTTTTTSSSTSTTTSTTSVTTTTTSTTTTSTTSTTTTAPVCNPACLNGGNCTATNVCTCSTAWEGSICQTSARIFWAFDGTLQDLYNNFNGIGSNGPTYLSPGYNGAGSCLWLDRSMNQSVTVNNPPFLNMSYTSLTLEVWLYAQTLNTGSQNSDHAILAQIEQNVLDKSLHFVIRNQRVYLGFYADDVGGNQILSTNQWYHVAYVYDYSISTQYVYVNGYLDASRASAGPYRGTAGSVTIGIAEVDAQNNLFHGCLDSMTYYNLAKNATDILNDATLVVYLPFDGNTLRDSGPLRINGTGASYSYTSLGRVNQALSLSNSSSYVQVTGFTRFGTDSWPYSLAVWFKPTSLTGGTILHLSSRTDGAQTSAWCLPMIGLSSSGQIAINSWNSYNVPLTGPIVPLNTWTHVVATYSPTNGQRLYVNGTLRGSVGAYTFYSGGVPMTMTLGSSLLGVSACNTGTIKMGQFYGFLDEFYAYARELNASEVTALANS